MNQTSPKSYECQARPGTPLVTLTLCGYRAGERLWAFNRMGSARREISRVTGLRFWKLLGAGHGGGFGLRPDFSRYGLLAVWEDAEAADRFFADSSVMASYRRHAEEIWSLRLLPVYALGTWSGVNPFLPVAAPPPPVAPVAVLTRASIRWGRLVSFWRATPATSRALDAAPGLLASIGTGEMPFIRPATFSLWRSETEMRAFAYGAPAHQEVIRRRRAENWYGEELFARFAPIRSEGKWRGRDPLANLL